MTSNKKQKGENCEKKIEKVCHEMVDCLFTLCFIYFGNKNVIVYFISNKQRYDAPPISSLHKFYCPVQLVLLQVFNVLKLQ